jgi:hypothetical protein
MLLSSFLLCVKDVVAAGKSAGSAFGCVDVDYTAPLDTPDEDK